MSKRFADDIDCQNIAHNGELIISGMVHIDFTASMPMTLSPERYDSYTRTWKPLPSVPFPRNRTILAVFGVFLYSFGGLHSDPQVITSGVCRLNLTDGITWQTLSPMPHPRIDQGSLTYNGRFYFFGAYEETEDRASFKLSIIG